MSIDEPQPEPPKTTQPATEAEKPTVKVRINADGSVTFEDLPPELLDLVHELDPDAVVACDAPTDAASDSGSAEESSGDPKE